MISHTCKYAHKYYPCIGCGLKNICGNALSHRVISFVGVLFIQNLSNLEIYIVSGQCCLDGRNQHFIWGEGPPLPKKTKKQKNPRDEAT